jgi:putative addiction module component (TIGR02574 family)
MTTAVLRKRVHKYVDKVDEKSLRVLEAMLTEMLSQEEESYLTGEQLKELDRRIKRHEAGEGSMDTWENVKARVRKKHKAKRK